MIQRSLPKRLWYEGLKIVCRLLAVVVFHVRWRDQQFVPTRGGALLLANHQSHLDPIMIGLTCERHMNYLARKTLFQSRPLAWLMTSLDGIAIDREGGGMGGLKETLRRLKRGEVVMIFPEGTRTRSGAVGPLKPGFCAIAKRAAVPLVPVAIAGAFEVWPRWHTLPVPGAVHIQFGPPILPNEIAQLDERQLLAEAEARIQACFAAASIARKRAVGGN